MSPPGGFLIQSHEGKAGNFEVIIPWSDSGLAHFGRANDVAGFPWSGPVMFGAGRSYLGATLIESSFKAYDRKLGNLEVLATTTTGEVHHFWRENGGAFHWHGPFKVFADATSAPSMADAGGGGSFYAITADERGGIQFWERRNRPVIMWLPWEGPSPATFVGVSLTLSTVGAASPEVVYSRTGFGGDTFAAGVSDVGDLHIMVEGVGGDIHTENGIPNFRNWVGHARYRRRRLRGPSRTVPRPALPDPGRLQHR